MRFALLIGLFGIFSLSNSFAQTTAMQPRAQETPSQKLNPNALAAKVIFLDYGMMNPELEEMQLSNGLEIAYIHNLNRWINIAVPAKVGLTNFQGDLNKTTIASLDAIVQLQYFNGRNKLVPYLFSGAGLGFENWKKSNFQLPFGLGLNIELGKNSYISLQGEYRKSQEEDRDNMQYGVGYKFLLGNTYVSAKDGNVEEKIKEEKDAKFKDRDKDGVADKEDNCPDLYGVPRLMGCPDADKDNIPDSEDDCPNQAGNLSTLGCPDSDGDGIADVDDDCPNLAGPFKTLGCPDSDGDGFADNEDECPKIAGKKRYNGCPEDPGPMINDIDFEADDIADKTENIVEKQVEVSKQEIEQVAPQTIAVAPTNTPTALDRDGDGVPDTEDLCPTEIGDKNSKGCPDSDGDGFSDENDECPLTRGLLNGCPDTDKDGINDAKDNCPDEAGSVAAGGCPDQNFVADEDLAILSTAMREVRFESGNDILLAESYDVLGQVRDAMLRYPNFRLFIEGHTDDTGNSRANQLLSEKRARACYVYLIDNGVSPFNVQYIGYGEKKPLADNKSKKGREINRRVEFKLEMK